MEGWKDGMGRDGTRPSQQMIRNDHWSFDQDLEGARSLGAVLVAASFVLPQPDMRPMLGLYWLRGCKGLQPSKVTLRASLAAILFREGRPPCRPNFLLIIRAN